MVVEPSLAKTLPKSTALRPTSAGRWPSLWLGRAWWWWIDIHRHHQHYQDR